MTARRVTLRAPTIAGFLIVLVAGIALGTIWFIDASDGTPAAAGSPEATAVLPEGPTAVLAMTSNMYGRPTRTADLVAIIPEGRLVRVTGQTDDSEWLRVIYPVTSSLEGWVPLANMFVASLPDLTGVPAVASVVGSEDGEVVGGLLDQSALPDLTVSSADVQPTGQLAVRITNVGRAPFAGTVGLRVTSADGEIVGVLDVDLTGSPLGPGRSASVNTGTIIRTTGLYVIEVDPTNEVEEASEFNNTRRVLLVGTGE
jgi:hypothetical protein